MYLLTFCCRSSDSRRSLSVVGPAGYRLFCVSSVNQVEEIFGSKQEDIKIAERLFSSSLVAVVTTKESTKLKVRSSWCGWWW